MAKGAYIGVATELPIYSEQITSASINGSNIGTFFTISHGSYGFYDSGNTGTFTTNNAAVNSGVAQTTLTALSDTTISFSYSYSSEPNYDKFTLTVAGITIENAVSGATTTKSYSGSVAKGQQIVFKYAKDGSVNKNNDKCTFSNMKVTATVKTQIGSETRNIAHKVKKGYIGVDSVARRIKKAYIGIGGVARPCFGGDGKLVYYGTIDPLSEARFASSPGAVGNYALFAGGTVAGGSGKTKTVDAYDNNLVRTIAPDLQASYSEAASTSVGNYAIFAGGYCTGVVGEDVVDAYNNSLTKIAISPLYDYLRDMGATTVGQYALFAGGFHYDYKTSRNYYADTIVVYDNSLTQTIMDAALPSTTIQLVGTTVGNYAIFCYFNWFAAYNESLTRTMVDDSGRSTHNTNALTVGQYALFAGGSGSDHKKKVDVFDSSLTRTTAQDITHYQIYAHTTLKNYAIFQIKQSDNSVVMDVYDDKLVKTNITPVSNFNASYTANTVGNYAIFVGIQTSDYTFTVDVYTIL